VEQGQVILALGINTDIHDLKEAQSQLLEKSDKLQSEVQVRAEQLQEARQQLDRDMAELRRVEVSLQESEFRFRTTVESSPIPIIIVSFPEIIILDANERMAEALRVPRADLIGRHGGQFNADREKNEMLVELVGKQGGVQDVELQIRRADGTLFWGLVSSRLIPYDNQQAIMVSLMDITNIKEHERVLQCERTTLRRLLDLNDRERTLVAYEIHDGIVQQMSGALMFLQAVEDELESAEPRIKKNVDTAAETLRDAVDEARRLIGELRPHLLEQEGMIRAIESLAEGMSVPGDFEVSVRNELTLKRVAPTIELAIFRIVQEALNNASRHSGSRTADVRLQQTEATISISIRDDGKGFDPAHTPKKRYGVEGIRERARLLGGTAAIESAPGQGTSVTVTLPIQDVLLQSD